VENPFARRRGKEELAADREPLWAHKRISRRELLRWTAVGGGALALGPVLAACRRAPAPAPGGLATPPTSGAEVSIDDLVAAAKQEGTLNTIALPPDWANYGEIMQSFQTKYGMRINNASPNASSAEELEAVRSLAGTERAPDVLDVGPSFAIQGAQEGLFAPYKVSTWDTIPDDLKDPNGLWVGDYWGVIALGVNTDIAKTPPRSFADLKNPAFRNMVALNGDPRESGAALAGVIAATIAMGGTPDDVTPGIDFFAELKRIGNFIPIDPTPATVASGETPITIDWDYLQQAYAAEFKGVAPWTYLVPADATYGDFYAQAINAQAPHPFAARLWEEFLYSDEGQLLWLKGLAHPARFQDMMDRGVIPQELLDPLPPPESYANVVFPTQEQRDKAAALVKEQWGPKVAGV
jgi:putative spermidine/putrescine transport system substrate-binding protein